METESAYQEAMKIDEDEPSFVTERGFYQPSTEDTWEAYQALIGIVEQQLGGFPTAVLCGVAHEVLSVLQCHNIAMYGKRYEIEKILNPLPDHTFDQLLEISDGITDFFKPDHLEDRRHDDGRDSMFVPEEWFYQPMTEETGKAYKLILDVVKSQIGRESQDAVILCTVAHEVLHILKSDVFGEVKNRKPFVENLVGWITDNDFNILLYAADLIQDFVDPRLGTVGSSSSSRVHRTLVGFGSSETPDLTTIRAVDFDGSVQNGGSGWEESEESQRDHVTRRLSQFTVDDIGDSGGDSDDHVSLDGHDENDEVDGGDEGDRSGVDGGDSGSDGFVVVEEEEDWVMIDDDSGKGTP